MFNNLFKKFKSKDDEFKTYSNNSSKPKMSKGEISLKSIVYFLTLLVIAILLIIMVFVAVKSADIFKVEGFWKFIFTDRWAPGANGESYYGIGGIIASTLMMMVIALLFAVPLTLFSALFISEYLNKKQQKFVMSVVKLLAGIPSVVFGLFAIDQIGPMFMSMGAKTGGNLMTASFTLAFMALPTMLSLSYNALQSVPDGYRLASLGLGITKEQTTFTVVRKSATPKIISAVIMGMARVIGETMAVILIAGNSAAGLNDGDGFGGFIFSSVKTLAGTIGLEMLENAGSQHESALYAIGLILFILVIIVNLSILIVSNADVVKKKMKAAIAMKKADAPDSLIDTRVSKNKLNYTDYELATLVKTRASNKTSKRFKSSIALFFMTTSTIIVLAFAAWVVGVVVVKGLMGLGHIEAFVTVGGQDGIFAALFTTILLIVSTLIFAIPLSLATAIYLSEYANKKSPLTKTIRFMIDLLASTPSIVFGIFGLSVFIVMFHLPMSIFASSLTMAIVVIPMLTSNFEDALSQVPKSYKEAGASLGLTKAQTLFKIVIPNAMEGIVTGVILAMAKIIGETAPVYLTLGTALRMPAEGFLSSGATLTTEIYMLASEGGGGEATSIAFLFSLITIMLVFSLNQLSSKISFNSKNKVSLLDRIRVTWINFIRFDYGAFFKNLWNNTKVKYKQIKNTYSLQSVKKAIWEARKRKYIIREIKKKDGA